MGSDTLRYLRVAIERITKSLAILAPIALTKSAVSVRRLWYCNPAEEETIELQRLTVLNVLREFFAKSNASRWSICYSTSGSTHHVRQSHSVRNVYRSMDYSSRSW